MTSVVVWVELQAQSVLGITNQFQTLRLNVLPARTLELPIKIVL
jgi:hypothetical protein